MPTGYTSIIEEGEGCTFEAYLWRCARAFGALVTMRDDSLDAPIPERLQPTKHHAEWALEAKARLDRLANMTAEEATRAAREDYERRLAEWNASKEKAAAVAARYAAIRAKAADWQPPTPEHVGLKEFMIEQIDLCTKGGFGPWGDPPIEESARAWTERQRTAAADDYARYLQGQREEEERTAKRNEWIDALRKP
jgi:hypothetical protein